MSKAAKPKPRQRKRPPKPTGPPPIQFGRAQKDRARELIGTRQYASAAAKELAKEFGFSVDLGYRLIAEVREDIQEELAGRGVDPATGLFLFFESFMAAEHLDPFERLAAAGHMMKLLGLKRLADKLGGEDVDAYLARLAQATPTPPKGGESNAGADPQTGREDLHRG
jgi:hypothetical protein